MFTVLVVLIYMFVIFVGFAWLRSIMWFLIPLLVLSVPYEFGVNTFAPWIIGHPLHLSLEEKGYYFWAFVAVLAVILYIICVVHTRSEKAKNDAAGGYWQRIDKERADAAAAQGPEAKRLHDIAVARSQADIEALLR